MASKQFHLFVLLLTLLLLSAAPIALAGKVVYKWSDDGGTIHYTATPPLLRGHKQINKDGLMVGETTAHLTREERSTQRAKEKVTRQKQAASDEESKRGRLLLATYRSEADIASRLEMILENYGGELELAAKALDSENERLRIHVNRAANLQRRGKSITLEVTNEIQHQRLAVSQQNFRIAQLNQDMAAERTKFARDLARYRDLNRGPAGAR
ncbi:MAG: DUF4124 domain-containing protein [Xanthomonadales bacterium]|nr:DUF4124 domain-containing protein [Xanthomonadales bacterium]